MFIRKLEPSVDTKSDFHQVLNRLEGIVAGVMPENSLVCMGMEMESKGRVDEITICTLRSGKVLLDAVVNTTANTPNRQHPPLGLRHPLTSAAEWLRNTQKRTNRRLGRGLDVEEVAQELREFMKPDTIILTWGTSPNDLRILRNFLKGDNQDMGCVLPDEDKCVFMDPHFISRSADYFSCPNMRTSSFAKQT